MSRLSKAGYRAELHELQALDAEMLDELELVLERGWHGAPARGFSMALDSLQGDNREETLVVLALQTDLQIERGALHPICR